MNQLEDLDELSQIQLNNLRKSTRFIRTDIQAFIIYSNFFGMKKTFECKLFDICSSGVKVSSTKALRKNNKLTLIILFDNGNKSTIQAKIVRREIIHHYLTTHTFASIHLFLKNKKAALKSIHLIENGKQIFAKYRVISTTTVKILSFFALNKNKQYGLIFTLSNGEKLTVNTQFENYQHHIHYTYGIKFDKSNDALGEHLLETQTDLVFK